MSTRLATPSTFGKDDDWVLGGNAWVCQVGSSFKNIDIKATEKALLSFLCLVVVF